MSQFRTAAIEFMTDRLRYDRPEADRVPSAMDDCRGGWWFRSSAAPEVERCLTVLMRAPTRAVAIPDPEVGRCLTSVV